MRPQHVARVAAWGLMAGLSAALMPACGGKTQQPATAPVTMRERQDRALHDPFGYKPDWHGTDVTGGDTAGLDKDALGKDLKHVLDP